MQAYRWPGNVRELKNVVERAVYRAPTSTVPISELFLDPFDSPYRPGSPPRCPAVAAETELSGGTDFRARVAELEQDLLSRALGANRFNQRATARFLGLSHDQLRNQLRKHGMSKSELAPEAKNV